MKYYAQFKVLSTGYISGSIPPIFNNENKRPIDLCGSDGVYILDGRLSLNSMVSKAKEVMNKHISKSSIVGFDIVRANRFTNDGKILHSYLNTFKR